MRHLLLVTTALAFVASASSFPAAAHSRHHTGRSVHHTVDRSDGGQSGRTYDIIAGSNKVRINGVGQVITNRHP